MPRGGNHRRLQAGDPYLQYAHLLFDRMLRDESPAGAQFREESDGLYLRYTRLLTAIIRYPVSGFGPPGPPPFNYIETFFETLLIAMPVEYPRFQTLTQEERDEAIWRRGVADIVSQKAWRRRRTARDSGDLDRMVRLSTVNRVVWNWALSIERTANPGREYRESTRVVVRRYLADVSTFCERWRLKADWSDIATIDYHFMRLCYGAKQPLALSSVATWEGEDIPLVVMVPGADPEAFERDRKLMVSFVMTQDLRDGPAPVRLNWVPDQDEQRRVERERNASCVVVRWDGHRQSGDAASINRYAANECAHRIGRSLTKAEVREIRRQLDPQLRDARNHFQDRGWHVVSDAPLREHARWLARRLLARSSFEEIASAFTPTDAERLLVPTAVARACRQFAESAHLTLPGRSPRRPARRA